MVALLVAFFIEGMETLAGRIVGVTRRAQPSVPPVARTAHKHMLPIIGFEASIHAVAFGRQPEPGIWGHSVGRDGRTTVIVGCLHPSGYARHRPTTGGATTKT